MIEPLRFDNDALHLIDQTKLPLELVDLVCTTVDQVHDAISRLVVRGAPAIGIAAAYGVCLAGNASKNATKNASANNYLEAIESLATSRPTAVNLFWALDRMKAIVDANTDSESLKDQLIAEARLIHEEDIQMGEAIGRHGATLLTGCQRVLTHCNAGGLATSKWGTALAPIYHLHRSGAAIEVFADETRPLMQGARLTAWELARSGVPVTVLTDSMAGSLLQTGTIDAVIVGADRIAANGDAANKIGTYPLAVLAKHHQVPFYVAAPSSTFDFALASGDLIPIEQRAREEVASPGGIKMVPDEASVVNPAFDVTPAELITAIITEQGNIDSPNANRIAELLLR
ncbi:Methylthioribose-1-phosphate isomerase [Rubripirellula obstinata]|uniref:Methylthioribose-1-phosphate isomerase n=1 Tax=Rubripirellula obstinata TaxID=406547 RepID=A0A5B1CQF9_9BACT|nr:S-methyl-5-thioribose-1-phosphate isomerase [Rubripirellula obstinata]KAA1261870.1 Methylthioribose-1-phosphate isomerase [Rubripirellula obstinata]